MGMMIDIDSFHKRYMFYATNKAEVEFNKIISEIKTTEVNPKANNKMDSNNNQSDRMTFYEAIETIKGNKWIACSEKYQEAMTLIETTINKYQKIKELVDIDIDKENFEISGAILIQIRKLINGNNN